MEIKTIDKSNQEQFMLLAQKSGTVFNQPEWFSLYDDKVKLYGIYDKDKKLLGGFHLYHTKRAGLTHITSPPFTPHNGLFFINNSKNKANAASFEKSIIALLADFFETLNYKILTIAFPPKYKDMQPFFWKKFKVIPNYTYQCNLADNTTENLLSMMSAERRNDLKKAEKDGINTTLTFNYEGVKKLVQKTFTRKEKSLNEKILDKIIFSFANEKNSFAFVSVKDGNELSCAFCIHDGHTAYYLLGGYDTNNKHQGAGAMAVWKSVQYAKEIGCSVFDFEGSMIIPVEKYLRAFGADLTPYFTVNKGNILVENLLKFNKRELF